MWSKFLILCFAFVASNAADCPVLDGVILGELSDSSIDEASGLAASRTQAGILYTHNDEHDPIIFVISEDGTSQGTIELEGVYLEDPEDITLGAGPEEGVDYLYLSDTGNNDKVRTVMQVYRIKEPVISQFINGKVTIPSEDITVISIISPNAPNDDIETIMSDPVTGDIYFLTRNRDDELRTEIYRLTPPEKTNENPIVLKNVGTIAYESLTCGDISADGRRILIRQKKNQGAWMYFRDVAAGQSVEDALTATGPCDLVLFDEEQPEAIAVDPQVQGFYTTSEGENAPVWYYGFMSK